MRKKLVQHYVDQINGVYSIGEATEYTYRTALENFLKEYFGKKIDVIHEATGTRGPHGKIDKPDFKFREKGVLIGYMENKTIGGNTHTISPQLKRYIQSSQNVASCNYVNFVFFDSEEKLIGDVTLCDGLPGSFKPNYTEWAKLQVYLNKFIQYKSIETIDEDRLASIMADKTWAIRESLLKLLQGPKSEFDGGINTLKRLYDQFHEGLVKNMQPEEFCDAYAQTLCYGLLMARLNCPHLKGFDWITALKYIPQSNRFLRNIFNDMGWYIPQDSKLYLEDLASIMGHLDISGIMQDLRKQQHDPIVAFYEKFLTYYDPKTRKQRGVWYTPEPIVRFMVNGIDQLLHNHFNMGLEDTEKINKHDIPWLTHDEVVDEFGGSLMVHRLQLLDVSTGTGTFLLDIIRHIYEKVGDGIWQDYVPTDLLPRLHGFEILMVPYIICYMRIMMVLGELGYDMEAHPYKGRLGVYLTNALTPDQQNQGHLGIVLEEEAKEARTFKRQGHVMVAFGNPPYSISSMNKDPWIVDLIKDYKQGLSEKNIQPLSDDYIKFIRMAEYYVQRTGKGVVALITNNSYLSGVIHRVMRKHMMQTFDQIYILNLHGNSRIKETTPTGEKDENVFDIQQGVCISFFVKKQSFDSQSKKTTHLKNNFQQENIMDLKSKNKLQQDNKMMPKFENNSQIKKSNGSKNNFQQEKIITLKAENKFQQNNKMMSKSENDSWTKNLTGSKDDFWQENNVNLKDNFQQENKMMSESENKNHKKYNKKLAFIYYADIHGLRSQKYKILSETSFQDIPWKTLNPVEPYYFFVPKDFSYQQQYDQGLKVTDIFELYNSGIKTARDHLIVSFTQEEMQQKIHYFLIHTASETEQQFDFPLGYMLDVRDWTVEKAQADVKDYKQHPKRFQPLAYRPLDTRWTYYTGKTKGFASYPRDKMMRHMVGHENVGLVLPRAYTGSPQDHYVFITDKVMDAHLISDQNYLFPLYRYEKDSLGIEERLINIKPQAIQAFEKATKCVFKDISSLSSKMMDENNFRSKNENVINAENIMNYLYGILWHPVYRKRYEEFIKIDFPRISLPKNKAQFWKYAYMGQYLRNLHTISSASPIDTTSLANGNLADGNPADGNPANNNSMSDNGVRFMGKGDKKIQKMRYEAHKPALKTGKSKLLLGKIWINDTQYFDNVPQEAWNMYIGSYQVARKYLKDRSYLSYEDVKWYPKLLHILMKTIEALQELKKYPLP